MWCKDSAPMMRADSGFCLRQPHSPVCFLHHPKAFSVIQVPNTVQSESKWRKAEERKEIDHLSSGLCEIIGCRERKKAVRRLFYALFPSSQGGAMQNVLEWEIFSDAEQRHISMNSSKPLDWLCAESNKLCCKEKKTMFISMSKVIYISSNTLRSIWCCQNCFSLWFVLNWTFLWFQAALWTQHMLHTASWYSQVFFNCLIK